jgi:hypothetical protein
MLAQRTTIKRQNRAANVSGFGFMGNFPPSSTFPGIPLSPLRACPPSWLASRFRLPESQVCDFQGAYLRTNRADTRENPHMFCSLALLTSQAHLHHKASLWAHDRNLPTGRPIQHGLAPINPTQQSTQSRRLEASWVLPCSSHGASYGYVQCVWKRLPLG